MDIRVSPVPLGRVTTVSKRFRLSAAHFLPEHDGKCRGLHGHNYTVELSITGPTQTSGPQTGMVIDFGEISRWWKETVDAAFDHKLLNDHPAFDMVPPTAEVMAAVINDWAYLQWQLHTVVRVWETDDSYAEV